MSGRSRQVLKTYATRWINWALLGLMAMAGLPVFLGSERNAFRTAGPTVVTSSRAIHRFEDLRAAVRENPNRPTSVYVGSMFATAFRHAEQDARSRGEVRSFEVSELGRTELEAEIFSLLGQLSQLEELDLGAVDVRPGILERVARFKSLKRLRLGDTLRGETYDLTPLQQLPGLTYLALSGSNWDGSSLLRLQPCVALRTLSLEDVPTVSAAHLREIVELRQLHTLCLPQINHYPPAWDSLGELRNAMHLREVYLQVPLDDARDFKNLRDRLPNLSFRSSMYSAGRQSASTLLMMWFFLGVQIIAVMVAHQFVLPLAVLAPGYLRAHQRVTWSLMSAAVVAVCLPFWLQGAAFLPILSIAAAGTFLPVLNMTMQGMSLERGIKPHWSLFAWVPLFLAWPLALMMPLLVDQFLMNEHPWLTLLVLVLAVVSGYQLWSGLDDLARVAAETGGVPFFIATYLERMNQGTRPRAGIRKSEERTVPQLDRATRRMTAVMGCVALVAVVLQRAGVLSSLPIVGEYEQAWFMQTGLMMIGWGLTMGIGAQWWMRVAFVPATIPLPRRRSDHCNAIFLSVARDYLALLPFAAALLVIFDGTNWLAGGSRLTAALLAALLLSGLLTVVYSVTMWLLPIRSKLGVVLALFLVIVAGFVLFGMLAAFGVGTTAQPTVGEAIRLATILLAGGAILALLARWRYWHLEWGRVTE